MSNPTFSAKKVDINTKKDIVVNNHTALSTQQYKALKYLFFALFMILYAQVTGSWFILLLGFGFFGAFLYQDWRM